MGKISKRLIIGFLCVAIVIGFIPNFNAPINAASETIHLTQADFNKAKEGTPTKGITYDEHWDEYTLNAGSYILDENIAAGDYLSIYSGSTVIDLNKKSLSTFLYVCGSDEGIPNVTIKGDGTITDGAESTEGATVTINGATFGDTIYADQDGILIINSAVVKANFFAIEIEDTSKATINGGEFSGEYGGLYVWEGASVSLSGGTFVCEKGYSPLANVSVQEYAFQSGIVMDGTGDDSDAKKAFESLLANGCEYSNQSQFEYSFFESNYLFYTNQPTITVINNNVTPENKQVTPEENNNNNNNNKKNYKNEWVDHQWYDSNGNTSYKYKGYWKCNEKGWWYEDENGWYPQDQWQKIDGKWYFFDAIGYMAQNEYAGSWSSYSEGNWWVGEDGAWDGSEPGVWRLSSNGKWWFKDSTGWFAQSKWYKIRGTWYYFDDEGWWDESKTE